MTRQRRVAVVSPQTRLALARRRHGVRAEVPHLAPVDAARARRVYRRQLRGALGALGALAALVLGLPLLIALAPGLVELRLVGVPVAWLAVAVLPYAVLVPLARWQLRRAERTERGDEPPPTTTRVHVAPEQPPPAATRVHVAADPGDEPAAPAPEPAEPAAEQDARPGNAP